MERRKFTREFKLEAVRLIKERGVSYAQASQNRGARCLAGWVLCLADTTAKSTQPQRRRTGREGSLELPRQ